MTGRRILSVPVSCRGLRMCRLVVIVWLGLTSSDRAYSNLVRLIWVVTLSVVTVFLLVPSN